MLLYSNIMTIHCMVLVYYNNILLKITIVYITKQQIHIYYVFSLS